MHQLGDNNKSNYYPVITFRKIFYLVLFCVLHCFHVLWFIFLLDLILPILVSCCVYVLFLCFMFYIFFCFDFLALFCFIVLFCSFLIKKCIKTKQRIFQDIKIIKVGKGGPVQRCKQTNLAIQQSKWFFLNLSSY